MDFAQELRELITAALETGIPRDTIITDLEDAAAFLTEQEAEKVEDAAKPDEDDMF